MTLTSYPRRTAVLVKTPPGLVVELARILEPVQGEHLIPQILAACRAAHELPQPEPEGRLSPRELDVLSGMGRDLTNHQIARELYLSEQTIKTHARRMFQKLGVATRAGAVAWGFRAGVLS